MAHEATACPRRDLYENATHLVFVLQPVTGTAKVQVNGRLPNELITHHATGTAFCDGGALSASQGTPVTSPRKGRRSRDGWKAAVSPSPAELNSTLAALCRE